MWLLFALLGFILGMSSGWLASMLLGGVAGYLLTRQSRLEVRLRSVENQLVRMRSQDAARITPDPSAIASVPEPATLPQEPVVTPPNDAEPVPVAETRTGDDAVIPPATMPPSLPDMAGLVSRLLSGNLLAKLGMVLLFFGIASALKLAIEHGAFPPSLRLVAATLAGLISIWAGAAPASGQPFRPAWLFRFAPATEQARAGFGFALEGGGFGILYIATYFALEYYGYLTPEAAFALFAGLGVACLFMAQRQNSQSFALLGVTGAFLAPMLVSGQGNHIILFTYLVLLDALILGVSLFRAWRLLILLSLVFSLALGMSWAVAGYHADLRNDVELFVLALFALYTIAPWRAARIGPPGQWGWQSAMLLFGPATAAAAAQSALYSGDTTFMASSSLGAGLWFGLLYGLTRSSGDRLLLQAQAGLALVFLSLAPYLAFSQNVASVFWALEGSGLVWFGMRSGRLLPILGGALLQLFSGLLLLDLWLRGPVGLPFHDSLFHASLLLVAAGGLSSFATRPKPNYHRPFLVWSLLWWFGAFDQELSRILIEPQTWATLLGLAALTSAALEWLGRRLTMPDARAITALLLPAIGLTLAATYQAAGHPLANGLWLYFPLAFSAHLFGLYRQERDGLNWFDSERHILAYWLLIWALAWEVAWQAAQFPSLGYAIPEALRALVLASAVLLVIRSGPAWPIGPHREIYLTSGLALPVLLSWLWLFTTTIALTGRWALPYVPLLNPLDASAVVLIRALYRHWQAAGHFGNRYSYPALFGLVLLFWLSLILARTVHHWTGVPFLADSLWHSALLQTLLSLSWTAYALLIMVAASRRQIRLAWFAGLGLLLLVCVKLMGIDFANVSGLLRVLSLIGVGLLVLGAGYLAPVPPRSEAVSEETD